MPAYTRLAQAAKNVAAAVKVVKEQERLEYVRRNAEEEARRIRALEAVDKMKGASQVRLMKSLIKADAANPPKVATTRSQELSADAKDALSQRLGAQLKSKDLAAANKAFYGATAPTA